MKAMYEAIHSTQCDDEQMGHEDLYQNVDKLQHFSRQGWGCSKKGKVDMVIPVPPASDAACRWLCSMPVKLSALLLPCVTPIAYLCGHCLHIQTYTCKQQS